MIRRRAGRVLVRDPLGAVLLCHASDGPDGWWFTPGGGVDGGEDRRAAAIRELAEETGIHVDLPIEPILHRRARFRFLGDDVEQVESFWLVGLAARPEVAPVHLEDYEAASLDDWRWCHPDDFDDLDDPLYPGCLGALLTVVDRRGPPAVAWTEEHLGTGRGALPTVRRPARPQDLPTWTGPSWRT